MSLCVCACVRACQEEVFACDPSSGAEGPRGLKVRRALGFDTFSVVVVHHLVRDLGQNALGQSGRGRLQRTEREGGGGGGGGREGGRGVRRKRSHR